MLSYINAQSLLKLLYDWSIIRTMQTAYMDHIPTLFMNSGAVYNQGLKGIQFAYRTQYPGATGIMKEDGYIPGLDTTLNHVVVPPKFDHIIANRVRRGGTIALTGEVAHWSGTDGQIGNGIVESVRGHTELVGILEYWNLMFGASGLLFKSAGAPSNVSGSYSDAAANTVWRFTVDTNPAGDPAGHSYRYAKNASRVLVGTYVQVVLLNDSGGGDMYSIAVDGSSNRYEGFVKNVSADGTLVDIQFFQAMASTDSDIDATFAVRQYEEVGTQGRYGFADMVNDRNALFVSAPAIGGGSPTANFPYGPSPEVGFNPATKSGWESIMETFAPGGFSGTLLNRVMEKMDGRNGVGYGRQNLAIVTSPENITRLMDEDRVKYQYFQTDPHDQYRMQRIVFHGQNPVLCSSLLYGSQIAWVINKDALAHDQETERGLEWLQAPTIEGGFSLPDFREVTGKDAYTASSVVRGAAMILERRGSACLYPQ